MQNGDKRHSGAPPYFELSHQLKIRASIVEAIVNIERQYVKILEFIVKVMKPSLEHCAEHIEFEIDDGHVRALFGNITALLEVHQALLIEIEKEVDDVRHEGSFGSDDLAAQICQSCLGKVFVDSKESFKVYDLYCSNYARAEKTTIDVLKMDSLRSTMKKWESSLPFSSEKLKGSTTLQVCLKEPLSHLCKISVLLKALAVFTPLKQPDLSDVMVAYSIVYATLTTIDATKRTEILQDAYAAYDSFQQQWSSSGLTNKEGFLTKRGGSIKSWKIRWFTLRSYEIKYFDQPVDEKSLGTLDMHQCKRVFESDSQMKPNCFALEFPDRTYFIYAINQDEKMEWMNLLAWKVYMLHSTEEKARLALSVPALGKSLSVLDLLHMG